MSQDLTYTLEDVLSKGFEARAVGPDGARYLWHGGCGLRADALTRRTTLLTDPSALPEGEWFPTALGLAELRETATTERSA